MAAAKKKSRLDVFKSYDRFRPLFYVLLLIASFWVGTLWQKVQYLEKGIGPTLGATTTGTQAAGNIPTPVPVNINQIKALFGKELVKFGDANKKVLFVEVGDPSCPYCHVAAGRNPELNNQMGAQFKLVSDGGTYIAPVEEMRKLVDQGKASFVYIYTPGHGNGEMGMKALYCANEKGKFWAVHDILMTNKGYDFMNNTIKNDKTKSGDMAEFVKAAVDPSFIKSCLDSGKYDARLQADVSVASSLGVSGTPGFFVNATTFPGAYSFKDMQSAVDQALK
jgi:protein-disulfide isomerase